MTAMAVSALFELLKSIMNGLIKFLKEKQKSFMLFINEMKASVKRFISHISSFVQTGVSSVIGTVISEIFGPIVSMFKKLASLIKQGVKSVIEAINYLTDKKNINKPISIKIAQVGKIIISGLATAGAVIGGELIEKALLNIPVMAVQIPFLGSIANLAGMFLSSLLCGVVGAIVINLIDKAIAKKKRSEMTSTMIDKGNQILQTQSIMRVIKQVKTEESKINFEKSIVQRHAAASAAFHDAVSSLAEDGVSADNAEYNNDEAFSEIATAQEECRKIQDSIESIQDSTDEKQNNIDEFLNSLMNTDGGK